MSIRQIVIAASFAAICASCSISKRHYTGGFYVARKGSVTTPVARHESTPSRSHREVVKNVPEPENVQVVQALATSAGSGNRAGITKAAGSVAVKHKAARPHVVADRNFRNVPDKLAVTTKTARTKAGGGSGDRSQKTAKGLVALVIIGMGGIHRMYLGYWVIGVIQLFTLGGFFIWAIIDLKRIRSGALQPKNGQYTDFEES